MGALASIPGGHALRRLVLLVLAVVLAVAWAAVPARGAGLAASPWPMFQHDPQHSGRSPYAAGSKLALKWSAPVVGLAGGPVIGTDGTIYVPTGGDDDMQAGSLYAIDPSGAQKWRFQFPEYGVCRQIAAYATPAVADDGTIYVHTQAGYRPDGMRCISGDSYLFAVGPDGTEKWHYALNGGAAVFRGGFLSSPAIGSDGTVYVGSADTGLYAIDPAGTLDWVVSPSLTSIQASPAIGPDGTIYISVFDLHAYEPDGDPKWTADLGDGAPNAASPSVGAGGTIYACFLNPWACHAVSPAGTSQWSIPFDAGATTPAIGADGAIYFANGWSEADGRLLAVEPTGAERWHRDFPYNAIDSPVIGSDGRLYTRVDVGFGAQGLADMLFVLNADGTESDRRELPEAGTVGDISTAIGADGTLYAPLPSKAFEYDPTDQHLAAYGPNGGEIPEDDTTPPALALSGRKRQRLGRTVVVRAACDEACTATATGTLRVPRLARVFRLRRSTRSIAAGGSARLKLGVTRKARRAARRALRRGRRVTAAVKVTAADTAGNRASKRRTIRIVLP